jgi:hypothetical protein
VKTGRKKTVISLKLSAAARAREGHRSYASSFAHELALQSEHLGNLIGHGPTIGGQREELLRALIERHVPTRFHVATGFVEGSDRQVDILIYDQVEFAPLFRAGNLVVVPPEAVRALIEVKSTLNSGDLEDALTHLEDAVGHRNSGPPIFRGIFAYKGATTQTLIDLMVEHYREPTDFDDNFGKAVFSIYEMATAVCILRKSLFVTGFCHRKHKGASQRAPAVMELASEAGRETQAALFFDMLSRFLRHPFSGTQSQRSLANRFAADIAQRNTQQLYPGRYWGPYLIDTGIDRVEAQVSAFESWLHGGAWNEPAPDPEYP